MLNSESRDSSELYQILQTLLHMIALDPTPGVCVPTILEYALGVSGADGAMFVIFDEAELRYSQQVPIDDLPSVEECAGLFSELSNEIHTGTNVPPSLASHFDAWMLIPLYDKRVVAVLALMLKGDVAINSDVNDMIESLVDALKIVTHLARTKARHLRHNRNQNEFMRIVSHDMRSPLTSMHGFGSMLESQMVGEMNEKQAHFVDKIMSGINQLAMQVDNMQDAGRYDPETGFYEMERVPTDLIEVAHQIVGNYLLPAEKQDLLLHFISDDMVPIVNVDQTMIERSIVNLVDNAMKYTPNGGRIEISVRHIEDEIVIGVRDNGLGISEENVKKLFNRHFRIHRREHKRIKGSGLGLFIVRSVALKHGGDAWVESVDGEGSVFYIRLPLSGANLIGADTD